MQPIVLDTLQTNVGELSVVQGTERDNAMFKSCSDCRASVWREEYRFHVERLKMDEVMLKSLEKVL